MQGIRSRLATRNGRTSAPPPSYPLRLKDDTRKYRLIIPGFPVTAAIMFVTLRSLTKAFPQFPQLKYRHCLGITATIDMLSTYSELGSWTVERRVGHHGR